MSLRVQKFGGTSVGSPERICHVADLIAKSYHAGNQLVIVVSAMGDTTDDLISLAHQVSQNPAHREMDMLLTAGERISMALLSIALGDRNIPAVSLTGSQTGIITDTSHRRARIQKILGDRVRKSLSEKKVVIVAGFQGVSELKEITTLGRGGSDTTAVALAAALDADCCEIYTDVDGVYTADPRIVPQAQHLKQISHDQMVELATRGAGVLHPRSVELACQYKVSLWVKSSFNEGEGTQVISPKRVNQGMEEYSVVGVTAARDKVFISVTLTRASTLTSLWDKAAQSNFAIISAIFLGEEVRFFSDRDAEMEWKKYLDSLVKDGFVKNFKIDSEIVPLSVIGNRFSQDGSALSEMIRLLNQENIKICFGSSSALAMTVGVSLHQVEEGLKILHAHFIEGQNS